MRSAAAFEEDTAHEQGEKCPSYSSADTYPSNLSFGVWYIIVMNAAAYCARGGRARGGRVRGGRVRSSKA